MSKTWLDRLTKECDTLQNKYNRLSAFLEHGEKKELVGPDQWRLMQEQIRHMKSYLRILNARVILGQKDKKDS